MSGFELIDIARAIMGPECRGRDWATEAEENEHVYKAVLQAQRVMDLWNTRTPDPAVAVLEAEVTTLKAALAGWLAHDRQIPATEGERNAKAFGLTNAALNPAPSEKEAG